MKCKRIEFVGPFVTSDVYNHYWTLPLNSGQVSLTCTFRAREYEQSDRNRQHAEGGLRCYGIWNVAYRIKPKEKYVRISMKGRLA